MIMTSQQGQQMIVTQVPRQHHVIMNQHSGNGLYSNFQYPQKWQEFMKNLTFVFFQIQPVLM